MSPFEHDLRESLKRREPPQGFAESVLARASAMERPHGHIQFSRWLAVAALVVLMVGGIAASRVIQERRRQADGEKAKEQLIVALRITGSKLRLAHEKFSAIQQRTIELQSQQ